MEGIEKEKFLRHDCKQVGNVEGGVGAELHFNYYHNVQSELDSFSFFFSCAVNLFTSSTIVLLYGIKFDLSYRGKKK
jgi:hypothetical protein